jgi:hypothetical protein
VTLEEQRKNRRERAIRKKEWQTTLDKYAEFAAYMVYLKRQEK